MKKLGIILVLAATVGLAGCASTGTTTGGGTTPGISSGNATVDAVVAATVKACGFLPTVQTAAGVLSTFVPAAGVGISIASEVANAICRAVVPAKMAGRRSMRAGDGPVVNGVPIEGRFIR